MLFLAAALGPIALTMALAQAANVAPRSWMLRLSIYGAATAYLALLLERALLPLLPYAHDASRLALELSFGLIAPVEELARFAILQHECTSREGVSARAMAFAGMALGSGFAALENVFYLIGAGTGWRNVALARLVTATPFHLANGVVGGILVWSATRRSSPARLLLALAAVILLHGAYDAPLIMGGADSAKFAFVLGLTIAVAFRLYRSPPAVG